MNCPKCGNALEENAKFCQKCGNPVSAPNMNTGQQPIYMTAPMQQQPVYIANPSTTIPKKNNIITIILGIVVVILVVALISVNSELESYKNRNPVDQTIDAIGSWFE